MPRVKKPKSQWPKRRARAIELVGGEKKWAGLIWVARRKGLKKKSSIQASRNRSAIKDKPVTVVDEIRGKKKELKKRKRSSGKPVHKRIRTRGQRPGREPKKEKKK